MAQDFAPDGALRDIYIENTAVNDWDRVLVEIRTRYCPVTFSIDGEPSVLRENALDILALRSDHGPLLKFFVGGIDVACHFFCAHEIEFDLAPSDVAGPERLDSLVEFLRRLAGLVGKPVILTHENMKEAVILWARAEGDHVEFIPTR